VYIHTHIYHTHTHNHINKALADTTTHTHAHTRTHTHTLIWIHTLANTNTHAETNKRQGPTLVLCRFHHSTSYVKLHLSPKHWHKCLAPWLRQTWVHAPVRKLFFLTRKRSHESVLSELEQISSRLWLVSQRFFWVVRTGWNLNTCFQIDMMSKVCYKESDPTYPPSLSITLRLLQISQWGF